MEWVYGIAGYIIGSAVTLLAVIVMTGRSERHEQKPHCVCDDCPHMR